MALEQPVTGVFAFQRSTRRFNLRPPLLIDATTADGPGLSFLTTGAALEVMAIGERRGRTIRWLRGQSESRLLTKV
jgi:hypothetical protein